MLKSDDVHNPEPAWDRNILSDLILAVRPYRVPEIGNAAAFWKSR